jgi:hypothetical protein
MQGIIMLARVLVAKRISSGRKRRSLEISKRQ